MSQDEPDSDMKHTATVSSGPESRVPTAQARSSPSPEAAFQQPAVLKHAVSKFYPPLCAQIAECLKHVCYMFHHAVPGLLGRVEPAGPWSNSRPVAWCGEAAIPWRRHVRTASGAARRGSAAMRIAHVRARVSR